jgi:hypothetical protein
MILGIVMIVISMIYFTAFFLGWKPLEKKVTPALTITFLGIVTSLLTLAIAYLFSGYENVKTFAWLIESALLF